MFCAFLKVRNCQLGHFRLSSVLIWSPASRIFHWKDHCLHLSCSAERGAAGTRETLSDSHHPAAAPGWATRSLSKPSPRGNRCRWQNPPSGRPAPLQLVRDAPQATATSKGETTNLPRPGDMDIRVSWTQPAACTLSVTHALCIPLSYSSLRSGAASSSLLPLPAPAAFPLLRR